MNFVFPICFIILFSTLVTAIYAQSTDKIGINTISAICATRTQEECDQNISVGSITGKCNWGNEDQKCKANIDPAILEGIRLEEENRRLSIFINSELPYFLIYILFFLIVFFELIIKHAPNFLKLLYGLKLLLASLVLLFYFFYYFDTNVMPFLILPLILIQPILSIVGFLKSPKITELKIHRIALLVAETIWILLIFLLIYLILS